MKLFVRDGTGASWTYTTHDDHVEDARARALIDGITIEMPAREAVWLAPGQIVSIQEVKTWQS